MVGVSGLQPFANWRYSLFLSFFLLAGVKACNVYICTTVNPGPLQMLLLHGMYQLLCVCRAQSERRIYGV